MSAGTRITFKKHGDNRIPAIELMAPSTIATVSAVRMEQCRFSLSLAPTYFEIIIVAPDASPFIKLIGNLNNVFTESIAARPTFPANLPTIIASTVI